ncbi:MAG TPA: hypothetical protein VMW87_02070 [Spirochaetia bacterium]|nr:hypothetical protein [Spirochaetia bacterium]
MKTLSLLRIKVEATTWLSRGRLERLRIGGQVWILPLAVIGFGALGAFGLLFLIQNSVALYRLGVAVGRPELSLLAAIFTDWALTLVVSFPIAISLLYFSHDTKLLLSLPIPPKRIVAANYLLLYAYTLPVQVLVLAPAFIIYLAAQGITLSGIVGALTVMLTGSLPPLALSVMLVLALTRAINISRHRVALETSGMVLLILMLIFFQVAASRSMMSSVSAAGPTAAMRSLAAGLISIGGSIPPLLWGAVGPRSPALLLPFAAVGAVMTLAAALLVNHGYLSQMMSRGEFAARKASRGSATRIGGILRRRPVMWALVYRELTILSSNSTFLVEVAGEVVILPLVLVIFTLVTPAEVLSGAVPVIRGFPFTVSIVLGVLTLMAGFNTVSATAISREGKSVGLSLSLPLSGRQQIGGKRACFFLLFGPAFILNVLIAAILLRLGMVNTISLIAAGIPVLDLIFAISIATDLRRPLLDWTHPQQAMKQNTNVLVSMGLVFLMTIALAAIVIVSIAAGTKGPFTVLLAGAAAAVGALLLRRPLSRYADERYASSFGR